MKILLIYPEFPDTFWSLKHALTFIRKRAALPPLGLLTVAAMLPEDWDRRLVDLNVRDLTDEDLAWADCAFISAMTVQRKSAQQVLRRCKAAGVRIVAGGPLFTFESDRFDEPDHFVLNEAELTLPPFIADMKSGCAVRTYASTGFADIRKTPPPMWELAEMAHYDMMSLQFSRGCPHDCDFCNVTVMLGHRPRTKSAAQFIGELDALYATGWRKNVLIVDDNFIGNRKQLKREILPAMIAWRGGKTGMPFLTEATIELADDEELMNLMREAGFITVFVGIETPNEASLSECRKSMNRNRDLVAHVKAIQRAGMEVQGGFIVGFDSDTPGIFQQQTDFIQESGIVTAMVGLLQAPYGTPLSRRLADEGRLLHDLSGDNMDGTTNIIPKMSIEALNAGYRRVLREIYSPPHYYARVRTLLEELRPPSVRAPMEFQHAMAFFRSAYRLGIKGVERSHFWKLLLRTLFRRPKMFPLAVTFSIMGFHFRKVSELHIR